MSSVFQRLIDASCQDMDGPPIIDDTLNSLCDTLPHEQFVKVLRIYDELRALALEASRQHYAQGLRDGLELAVSMKQAPHRRSGPSQQNKRG